MNTIRRERKSDSPATSRYAVTARADIYTAGHSRYCVAPSEPHTPLAESPAMLPHRKRFVRFAIRAVIFVASTSFAVAALMPLLRSTKKFRAFVDDARVRYEPGAENAAAVIARALPEAIATIERAQFQPFANPVEIFVCASTDSFERYGYGVAGAGGFVFHGRLFISPKPQNTAERLPRLVTHELSHLHLDQRLGLLRFAGGLPGWFKEGLAVYVSGSGAETVGEAEARDAITHSHIFKPDDTGSLFFPQTGTRDGLKVHLFYRESAMFVEFLAHRDSAAFKQLLLALEDGQSFADAMRRAYGADVATLQAEFAAVIKNSRPLNAP